MRAVLTAATKAGCSVGSTVDSKVALKAGSLAVLTDDLRAAGMAARTVARMAATRVVMLVWSGAY